jgi:class 3 adenylate cyclase/predicted ATPase
MICVHCLAANADGAVACTQCGARFELRETTQAAPPFYGERRQLTALFCDLAGSTEMASALDPEDYHELIRAFAQCCRAVIERFGGHIAEFRGDGALVFYGYPQARGDEPERAVRTGLAIVDAVEKLVFPHGQQVRVRIGIATGLMAIDVSASIEPIIVGEALNLAMRLQELADPNTIVVSDVTRQLTGSLFVLDDMGSRQLKGFLQPVPAFRVAGANALTSQFEALRLRGLTNFVGRRREMEVLGRAWERAKAGAGNVVTVSGEPGIGKSRLIKELRDIAIGEGRVYEYFGSPYHVNTAFHPIVEQVARSSASVADATPEARYEALGQVLARIADDYRDHLPWIAALASLPERDIPPYVTPEQRKQKTFAAILWWLGALSRKKPLLVVIEDAHWMDPTSLEVLRVIADRIATMPLLLVLSFRSQFNPSLDDASVTQLALDRLKPGDAIAIVTSVAGESSLPREWIERIVEKTDGIPLFVEELTKMLIGSGVAQPAAERASGELRHELPKTLQDSLMARLDQLGPLKRVAQMAAVIGQQFHADTLRVVSELEAEALQEALSDLVKTELILADSSMPLARFAFNHALVRDAAYESLLKRDRRQLHAKVAAAFEAHNPSVNPAAPELLAHHYTEAGLIPPALKYWGAAAHQALQRSANLEALRHASRGLEILAAQPDGPDRRRAELGFRLLAGLSYWGVKGFAAPEVEENFTRAHELATEVGDIAQRIMSLRGLFGCHYVRGELDHAFAQAQRVAELARLTRNDDDRMVTHMMCGTIRFWQGAFLEARTELETGLALYDPQRHAAKLLSSQIDPSVNTRAHLGWTLWSLGYPDQALAVVEQGLATARRIAQPISLAQALFWTAAVRLCRCDVEAVDAIAEELSAVAAKFPVPYFGACASVLKGAVLVANGENALGLTRIQQAFAAFGTQQASLGIPWALSIAASGHLRNGAAAEALDVVARALAIVEKHGERQWEAELHRLKGACLATDDARKTEAAACLNRALEVARRQGARGLELRAATTLANVIDPQAKDEDVRQLLGRIYAQFTEGLDTADLRAAKRLLDEYEPSVSAPPELGRAADGDLRVLQP